MQLCSECKKNIAVLYISANIDGQPKMRGLCLSCAKKLAVPGIDQLLKTSGINEDELDDVTEKMNSSMANFGESLKNLTESEEFPEELMNSMKDMYYSAREFYGQPKKEEKKDDKAADKKDNSSELFDDYNYSNGEEEEFFSGMNRIFGIGGNNAKPNQKKESKTKTIDKYGTNLTNLAKEGKLDPVIGRKEEIKRVIQILNRRTKNNPVLLGQPGVGKTAIAEGLATLIAEKKVPLKLQDYQIVQLEMGTLVAGTQFRGQFEGRMNSIVEEAKAHGKIILVIDELHSIMGAGEVQGGSLDAANILKPALSKGHVQIIGATTTDEYRRFIEKDKALERRFQPVPVDEPNEKDSVEIIKGLKKAYEDYHDIKLTDEVIEHAVKISKRYITDRFLPDKAIDLIDEAGSKANLENHSLDEIKKMEAQISAIKKLELKASEEADYEKAASYKQQELKLQEDLKELENNKYTVLTKDDIASVVEQWTKIPAKTITTGEGEKLMSLEKNLQEKIIGQDDAISAVSRAIRRNRSGVSSIKKPATFLFVGPTGVGKTQLVKDLAKEMFGSSDMMIRLDMSEYMEKHSVSKMVGSPPGYVGYDDGGQLTDKIKRKPYSIVLLDEIEKAHPDVFNMLLQIMEDGHLTDAQGQKVSFENSIIIMTSNVGTSFTGKTVGFGNSSDDIREEQRVQDSLKDSFKPEFLNRIDEIVVFKSLDKDSLMKIVDIMLEDLNQNLISKGIHLIVTDEVKDFLIEKGYSEQYGARPLRRVIQKYIEDEVATIIIERPSASKNLTTKLMDSSVSIEMV